MSPSTKEPGADFGFQDRQTDIRKSSFNSTSLSVRNSKDENSHWSCPASFWLHTLVAFLVVPVAHKLNCLDRDCMFWRSPQISVVTLLMTATVAGMSVARVSMIHQRLCKFHIQTSYQSIDSTLLIFLRFMGKSREVFWRSKLGSITVTTN